MSPKNWSWYVWPIITLCVAPLGTIFALNIENYAQQRNWDRLYQLPLLLKIVGIVSDNILAFVLGISAGMVIWHYWGINGRRQTAKATTDIYWPQQSIFDAAISELEHLRTIATPEYQESVRLFENERKAKNLDENIIDIKNALDLLNGYMKALPSAAQKPADAEMQGSWNIPLRMASEQFSGVEQVLKQHGFIHDLSKAPNYDKNHARPVPDEAGITDPIKLQEYRRIYDQHKNAEAVVSGVIRQLEAKAADRRIG